MSIFNIKELIEKMNPVILSALSALVAVILSLYIASRTVPKERPVINIPKADIKYNLQGNILKIDMIISFMNTGLHPASDINIEIAGGVQNDLNSFKNLINQTMANSISPNTTFKWTHGMSIESSKKAEGGKPIFSKKGAIFLIRVRYKDMLSFFGYRKRYKDDYWLVYYVGDTAAGHATIELANQYKSSLLKYFH